MCFLESVRQSTPLNSRKLRQAMQKRTASTGLISKTLKRRPEPSAVHTPPVNAREMKKRKALNLSSDSSLEDGRAPGPSSLIVEGVIPSDPDQPGSHDDVEEQLLNGDDHVLDAVDYPEFDNETGEITANQHDNEANDDDMEVDAVDMTLLPFHDAEL